jgi:CDP-glucose 4,6-dehydratase
LVPQSELVRTGLIERVKTVRGDIRDSALMERVLGEYEIDTVFHLAAQTIVGIANRNPVSTLDVNIAGTYTVLEACRRSPLVKQVVLAFVGPRPMATRKICLTMNRRPWRAGILTMSVSRAPT